MPPNLRLLQRLETSGARAVEPFRIDGEQYLAVAQLARDVPGRPASLNGGSSDTTLPVYRWQDGRFGRHHELAVPGGEDAEFFTIGERAFLAAASLRTGNGPYELNATSTLFEWRRGRFEPFQSFDTFAAKQWRHLRIDDRHFLALAQGVAMDGVVARHAAESCIFEWSGTRFELLQTVPSAWGYNWRHVEIGGHHLLAYADHVAPSRLLQWTGSRFDDLQVLDGKSGRAFAFFRAGGADWLAFANLLEDSVLLRWSGSRFEHDRRLCGPGAREFAWLPDDGCAPGAETGRLVQANFMLGSREAPQPMAQSCVHRFDGQALDLVEQFDSSGAVDVAPFACDGRRFVALANSLAPDLRFRTDAMVYEDATRADAFDGETRDRPGSSR